ncbi:MAG: lipopolysaccharide transport periplasmic protein LptA [Gammaproteobacteria bacterium]|nr:lipopolysaccharide transport periplasmic protein LptA [Gammaproteobacteria bacterium]
MIYAPVGLTVTSGSGEDVHVQANYMMFDMETGSSTYKGDVKISQGSIKLNGDKVIIQRQQDKIQQINIDGQPAQYIQDEDSKNKIHATSKHMQYLAGQHRLVMTVDARLQQPDHTIESQRIVYDTKNKIVIAGNNKKNQQGGRVNITLTPKKDDTTAPANTEKP